MKKGKVSIGIDVHKRKCVVCVMDDAEATYEKRPHTRTPDTMQHSLQRI